MTLSSNGSIVDKNKTNLFATSSQRTEDDTKTRREKQEYSERVVAESHNIMGAAAEVSAVSAETGNGLNPEIERLYQRIARLETTPSFFIRMISHSVTPILGVLLLIGGIALVGSGAGASVGLALGITMGCAGVVLVGISIAAQCGFFSNKATKSSTTFASSALLNLP